MDRTEEIRVLLISLVQEDQEEYVDKLLHELQLIERKSGYYLFRKLCSKVANAVFNKHEKAYPSNVLDYMTFLCHGGELDRGWKPNDKVHKKMLEYYKSEIEWKIND